LMKFLDTWRRYRPLWKVDKVVTLEKFAQKKPHWSSYDEKLIFYTKLARDVAGQPNSKDVDFIRVNVVPLQTAIEQEANAWVNSLGKLLNDLALKGLTELTQKLDDFYRDMTKNPETLDELTNVLNVISIIRSSTEEVETKFRDIMECYRTLSMYNIPVESQEKTTSNNLPARWEEILTKAAEVDAELVPVKIKFTETTVNQVKDFRQEIKAFKQDFLENGPGSADLDMDKGLEALQKTKENLVRLNERREQLVRAEKLFNLPISSYSDLYDVEHQVKELERIYELYSDVKTAINGWSSLLWSSLDGKLIL